MGLHVDGYARCPGPATVAGSGGAMPSRRDSRIATEIDGVRAFGDERS
jgi:hypothetical protein